MGAKIAHALIAIISIFGVGIGTCSSGSNHWQKTKIRGRIFPEYSGAHVGSTSEIFGAKSGGWGAMDNRRRDSLADRISGLGG